MNLRFSEAELALQRRIKDAFDPVHILTRTNPARGRAR